MPEHSSPRLVHSAATAPGPTQRRRAHLRALPSPGRAISIAYVTETYPPEVNGVALTVAHTVRFLREQGHRVEVVRPRQRGDGAHDGDHLVAGIGVPRYPGMQIGLPASLRLLDRWRSRRPQVVHIATEGPLGWSALKAARALGIPVTTDYRTHFHRYSAHYGVGWLARVIGAYLRSFHNRADATFVATDALRGELAALGYRNLVTMGRGIDTRLFSPARRDPGLRAAWGVRDDELAVLYVGRLAPEKNLDLAARAYEAIRRRHPSARMIWVGDGPARSKLERAWPHHRFCGLKRDASLAAHYASADLFLFPSMTETFGNVTLEALASGLPVVAYDYGAAAQHARDGVHARLVPLGDVHGFVAAAVELASLPAVRAAMRTAAPRIAAGLAWPKVLAAFESHLVEHAMPGGARPIHAPR